MLMWKQFLAKKARKKYENLSTQQIFTKIYADGVWGKSDQGDPFFSGSGSHNNAIVETYVKAINNFLCSLKDKPNVVDLGCGDFYIGSKIRHLCNNYIACDIVEPLITFNTNKYKDTEFRVLNIVTDDLPLGEIVFIRQVLQHLSNDSIIKCIPKLAQYKYLVLSESVPVSDFIPNVDKPDGPDTRGSFNTSSGIVLTSPPFNLKIKEETTLCELAQGGWIIKTTLYRVN